MTFLPEKSLTSEMVPAPASRGGDEPAPFATHSGAIVLRMVQGEGEFCHDTLAEEVPVALVYNGLSHAVMLASPERLEDLAYGFSLTEGIVEDRSEIYDVEIRDACDGIEVAIEISSRRFEALKHRRRSLAGRTGCGLCGTESLKDVTRIRRQITTKVEPVAPRVVASALVRMQERQTLHRLTGSVHGVAWVSREGEVLELAEDVGRHNAMDKLIGHMARHGVDPCGGFVLTSSRTSYEMVQKCVAAGIGLLVAVSAPTALAVRLATGHNLTLAGFARGNRLVVYAHPETLLG